MRNDIEFKRLQVKWLKIRQHILYMAENNLKETNDLLPLIDEKLDEILSIWEY